MENLTKNTLAAQKCIQQLPSSSALLDIDYNLVDASSTWFQSLGLNRDEVLGKPFPQLFSRFDDSWEDAFEYAKEGLTDIKLVDNFKNENGISQDFIWKINPWKNGYGDCVGIILNQKDFTEKAALEVELKNTRKLLKEKSRIAQIGSWEYNFSKKELYLSKELREIFNVPAALDMSLAKGLSYFATNQSASTIKNLWSRALNQNKPWNRNLKMTTHSGNVIWANIIGRPKFSNGKCSRIIGTIQNINDSYVEEPLETIAVEKENNAFDQLKIGVAIIDFTTGRIKEVNQGLQSTLGINASKLVGESFQDYFWFTPKERRKLHNSIKKKRAFDGLEKEVFHADLKRKIVFSLQGKLVFNKAFGKKELIVTCQDITAFSKRENTLKAQLDIANDDLDKMTHFTHMMTHNLRGHATNVDLVLNFLKEEKNEAERQKFLEILSYSTENLAAGIKDLRQLVTVRHQLHEKKRDISVSEIVYKVLQNTNGLLKKHKVKVHNEIADDAMICAIPVYLESIVSSLLTNAINFRNENKTPMILLGCQTTSRYTILTVEDNGIGIDLSKEKDKVFAIYKTSKAMENPSGLGLYLAKYQVELMRGKITVESKPNEGSIFKIHLPLQ